MNFVEAIRAGFSNYLNFKKRACRSEFWYWQLFIVLAGLVAELFDYGTGLRSAPFATLFGLATLIPAIAVSARRLHDTDRSGWWLLLVLVPFFGTLLLIVWWCMRGTTGYNRFGADYFRPGGYATRRPAA
ncbi:MAG: DUF805 domain-containing protein [Xanthobacteraceae bacterium]